MSALPPPTCELDQWMLAEAAKRQRSGEAITTLLVGTGAEEQAVRVAESGARVLLLCDRDPGHVNIVQRPAASFADTTGEFPLQPFDIILCQRMLSSLRYADARTMVRSLLGRLRIGGKLFVSCYGIHSDLGDHYADSEKLVAERFATVAPALAARYGIEGPLSLYSERNLFMLLMECGAAVLKTSSSALGHVRGIAARI